MLSIPDLEHAVFEAMIQLFTVVVERIGGHERGVGLASPNSYQYYLSLNDHPPDLFLDSWCHVRTIPLCHQSIASTVLHCHKMMAPYVAAVLYNVPALPIPRQRKSRVVPTAN